MSGKAVRLTSFVGTRQLPEAVMFDARNSSLFNAAA
jgi:hypothetical protein